MRILSVALLSGLLVGAGCKSTAPVKNADGSTTNPNGSVTVPGQATPSPQGVLNSDGSYTNPDGSVTYPANSPVAEGEKEQAQPSGPPPVPSAAPVVSGPAQPVSVSAPAGTAVVVRLNGGLASSRNEVGDHFTAVLERPVISHGQVVFAKGLPVSGEVVASKGKGRFKGAGDLGIELTAIGRESVKTSEYEKVDKGQGKRTGAFIGGGAGLGTILGAVAGGGRGAVIGGLAGAGAGTAGAATGGRAVVIPAESVITFRLRTTVTRG